jgi:7-cyano-7-deazaguanine synthase in queuosine biosynthesis
MQLDVSVVERDFWNEPGTVGALQEALELLGSDVWDVRFSHQRADPDYIVRAPEECRRVCLFSGGLDSAAGLATQLRTRRDPMLIVTLRHQRGQKERVRDQVRRLQDRYGAKLDPVVVPTKLLNGPRLRNQELTQRCRSFLFAALGGAVACTEGSTEVEVYESGVGAINVPLLKGMATGARTTKSSHPHFLRLMSKLVSRMADRPIDFVLPHRDYSKADLVRNLVEDGLSDLANSTISCVHYPVRLKAKQCGYCPACIGRRLSMILGGVAEPDGVYAYDLFGAPDVTNSIEPKKFEYLWAMLKQVDYLAELERRPLPEWFTGFALRTGVEGSTGALQPWVDVLLRYRREWLDLVEFGKSKGWNWARLLPVSCAA